MIGWKERIVAMPAAVLLCTAALAAEPAGAKSEQASEATGRVFEDANGNGRRDEGEAGVAGVSVSNGERVVRTDERGRYRLPVQPDTAIFVIKPAGWMTPTSPRGLPRFYYLHKPDGSPDHLKYPGVAPTGPLPESIDFPLRRREEPERFRVVMFGDPQVRNQREVDYLAHDILEELGGVEAAFGVSLGDLAFNKLDIFEGLNRAVGTLGLPWYNVLGNHDENYRATGDRNSDETFERVYGPSTYGFNYGRVHFLVLDDVVYREGKSGRRRGKYDPGLSDRQLTFIENDLAHVPEDRLVVLMMHIPLNQLDSQQLDRLMSALGDRPQFSLSAHSHVQRHYFLGTGGRHHHFNQGTTCGTWWKGRPNERGIPNTMMRDGTPNGYSIITFDGAEYSLRYKAAGYPADYQMSIHAPEAVAADEAGDTVVLANVFAGSKRSTVEMRVGEEGRWKPMEKNDGVDPRYQWLFERSHKVADALGKGPYRLPLKKPRTSYHIWRGTLPADLSPGSHVIQVRAKDVFGHDYRGRRVFRVKESAGGEERAGS